MDCILTSDVTVVQSFHVVHLILCSIPPPFLLVTCCQGRLAKYKVNIVILSRNTRWTSYLPVLIKGITQRFMTVFSLFE